MYEHILNQAGLTQNQGVIYELLIKEGALPAGKIAKKTAIKRSLVYKVVEELLAVGLVEKAKDGKVARFAVTHPLKLKEYIEKREQQVKDAQLALGSVLPALISTFNLATDKPGIRFFAGVFGLEQIYEDILQTGKDFSLVRSAFEPTYSEQLKPAVERFIEQRVKRGMRVYAITPRDQFAKLRVTTPEADKAILFERTWVDASLYSAPVEIDIYGDKIALLSFGTELIGVIIQSPQIANALQQIFALAKRGATDGSARPSSAPYADSPKPPASAYDPSRSAV